MNRKFQNIKEGATVVLFIILVLLLIAGFVFLNTWVEAQYNYKGKTKQVVETLETRIEALEQKHGIENE